MPFYHSGAQKAYRVTHMRISPHNMCSCHLILVDFQDYLEDLALVYLLS
jgi:hypothetical protein